jgi:NAD+ synthase (glutamine-hydrolysing)
MHGRRESLFHTLASFSERGRCAVAFANATTGESTTDFVFSGNSFIFENGEMLSENKAFSDDELSFAVVDFEKLSHERMSDDKFISEMSGDFLYIPYSMELSETKIETYEKSQFIPKDENARRELCELTIKMQSQALAKRMKSAYAKCLVIGVSGGLDSTLALLVCAEACDILKISRENIIAVTMPCFGTTKRTKNNALSLADALGATVRVIDVKKSVLSHFKDIGHAENNYNVVYENAQARERTQVLMDLANELSGIVVGTGDLSELALGFATYNGDHISNYGVNAGVPKTLLRSLISYYASISEKKLARVLLDVLNTPVSPELLPPKDNEIAQCTEGIVGPYELHDFFLYHLVRYGFSPKKIRRLASIAFADNYDEKTVTAWLKLFLRRFVSQQFKRSALPDGVKLSKISLSPRGGLVMPSDADGKFLLAELDGENQ